MISAIIITHNEERNIGRCLQSLQGVADEVVVVDSGSTDQTETLCRSHGVRFVGHEWQGYAEQKNYANSLATGDWLLSIDADEALSEGLRDSLLRLKSHGFAPDTVYQCNRLTNYGGHWIKHCGWYPDTKTRLFAKGSADWDGLVHEELQTHTPCETVTLEGDLLHYSYQSFDDLINRQRHYALLAAEKEYARGRRCGMGAVVLKPGWKFIRDYLLKGGLLDGAAGYTVCRTAAFYTFIKYARLHELTTQQK